MEKPRLSYAGKTIFFESFGKEITRRDFIKHATIISAGVAFFGISLNKAKPSKSEATITCCYSNCFQECYSKCGRKTW